MLGDPGGVKEPYQRLAEGFASRWQFFVSRHGTEAQASAEASGDFAVAEEAERAEVIEVALAAAFGYGEDVVGVPQAAAAGDGFHAVEAQACGACCSSRALQGIVGGDGIDAAEGTASAVAGEDVVAQVAGVGAHAPLMDAVVGAKGSAAFRDDLEIAPAAERKAVGTFGESVAAGAAAGEGAGEEHTSSA